MMTNQNENSTHKSKKRTRCDTQRVSGSRWVKYAAAGAATLAAGQRAAETADAGIVHIDPTPDPVIDGIALGTIDGYYLNMNPATDTVDDFILAHFATYFGGGGAAITIQEADNGVAGFFAAGPYFTYFYPSNLGPGVNVSTQQNILGFPTSETGTLAYGPGYPNSQWLGAVPGDSVTGFLGVSFLASGDRHYGWIRLTVGPLPENQITLHDWAYNDTPDGPIETGQIPEPGSLGLLALGGAGLLAWRRRRAQAAVERAANAD